MHMITIMITNDRQTIARILKEVHDTAIEFSAKEEDVVLVDVKRMEEDYDDACRPTMRRLFSLVAGARDSIMIADDHGRRQRALQEEQRNECMRQMDSVAYSISPTEEKVAAFCSALRVLQKHARSLSVFLLNAKLHRMGHVVEEHGIVYEGAALQVFFSMDFAPFVQCLHRVRRSSVAGILQYGLCTFCTVSASCTKEPRCRYFSA
jgi:hypothetical protein